MTGVDKKQNAAIGVAVLLFAAFAVLPILEDIYRGVFFVVVFPLVINAWWSYGTPKAMTDRVTQSLLLLVAYLVAGSFLLVDNRSENIRILKSGAEVCVFVVAAHYAARYWLDNPLSSGRALHLLVSISSALALASWLFDDARAERLVGAGMLSHPVTGASILVTYWALGVILHCISQRRNQSDYFLVFVASLLTGFVLLLTRSRGPMLAALVFGGLIIASVLFYSNASMRRKLLAMCAAATSLFIGFLLTPYGRAIANDLIVRKDSYRIEIFAEVSRNPPRNLWLGNGATSDFPHSDAGLALLAETGQVIEHAHNLLLGLYLSGGIVAGAMFLTSFLLIGRRILYCASPAPEKFLYGCIFLLVVLLNFSDNYTIVTPPAPMWVIFWLPTMFLVVATEPHRLRKQTFPLATTPNADDCFDKNRWKNAQQAKQSNHDVHSRYSGGLGEPHSQGHQ